VSPATTSSGRNRAAYWKWRPQNKGADSPPDEIVDHIEKGRMKLNETEPETSQLVVS